MARTPPGSSRLRTTAAITLVVAIALSLGAWVLLQTLESALLRNNDDAARSRARDIAVQLAGGRLPRPLPTLGDDSVAQVVDESGRVLAASRNTAGRPAIATFRPSGPRAVVRTVEFQDGPDLEHYRVWALRAEGPSGPVTVYVGTSLELVDEAVTTLRRLLLPSLPLAVVVLAGLTWVVVGRLLARLEANSRRQRAFAADASHELQTPLTAFRAQLEVALTRPGSADWPVLARELLQGTQEMERLVRDLLFLAREDEQADANLPTDLVDLDDVVLEEVARVRGGSSVVLDTSKVSGAPVRGSREQLVRLVRNLLENAERHASTRVDIRLSAGNGDVHLVIADDGPGVPVQDRERIFERFVRLDDARARHSGGSGLGLAIADAIARRHGGSVELVDSGPGATFVLDLPAAR